QNAEKDEAMDDVRKTVPVRQLLRHVGAKGIIHPEQNVAARREEGLAERVQHRDLNADKNKSGSAIKYGRACGHGSPAANRNGYLIEADNLLCAPSCLAQNR